MKKLAIVFAVGAAALLGGSAANAADNTVKAKAATDLTQQSTDFSSRGRPIAIMAIIMATTTTAIVVTAHTMATATATLRGRTTAVTTGVMVMAGRA